MMSHFLMILDAAAFQTLSRIFRIEVNVTRSGPGQHGASYSTTTNMLANALENEDLTKPDIVYDDILDYVGWHRDYRRPMRLSQRVVPLKAAKPWSWDKLKVPGKNPEGLYNDISDHYPVVADIYF